MKKQIQVRLANIKTNKSSTIFGTNSQVVALAPGPQRNGFISGHADGSIVRYFFDGADVVAPSGKICTHPCPPYCLAWTPNSIVAAGCDKRFISYSPEGKVQQQFDYSQNQNEREFSAICASPSGQAVVVGSFDRLRAFNWNGRRGGWEEGKVKEIPNFYTVTGIAWKPDGTKLVVVSMDLI